MPKCFAGTRNVIHLKEFLKDFSGIYVTDGYEVYHTVENKWEDLATVPLCDENVIQISNIAKMSIADAMAEPYQMVHFVMVLVGVICLMTMKWLLILIGLAAGALGIWLIYKTYQRNQ